VRFGKQQSGGKALLETSEILFRGEFRLKIPFSTIKSAKAVDGELRLQTAKGSRSSNSVRAAEKWCEKIVHPKSRIEKLGVKPGAKVSLLDDFAPDFLDELGKLTKSVSKSKVAPEFGMDLFRCGFERRSRRLAENLQINERRCRALDRLSQGQNKSPKTMFSPRPQVRPKRCEGRRLFHYPHCTEICHPAI